MAIYKLFTWNMQRAQSVSQYNMASSPFASNKDNQIRERYRVLKRLVDWADFGFIIEPGQDIRTNLNNFSLPGLQRNFLTSQCQDNQTDASACRPVVYSKTPFGVSLTSQNCMSAIYRGPKRRTAIPLRAS